MEYRIYTADREDGDFEVMAIGVHEIEEVTEEEGKFNPEDYFKPGYENITHKGSIWITGDADHLVSDWFSVKGI